MHAGDREPAALPLLLRMLAIPGKSCQERQVIEFITGELKGAGLPDSAVFIDSTPRVSPAGGEIGNLIVKLPGTRRLPRRLLMAHVDTVPLCVGAEPIVDGDRVRSKNPNTALGGDNRSGATVLLNTALTILRDKLPHPPLTFFWPVQEEIGLYGARFVNISKLGNPKLCFNWDGGDPSTACIGATGDYNLEIDIEGIASHAGVHPEHGVSAIAIASRAIADLHANGWHGLVIKGRRTGSSNVGVIQGGDATNVVTPKLHIRAEVRSHDPKFRLQLVNEFRKAFERAAREVKNSRGQTGRVHFQADLKYESFRLAETEPAVTVALAAIQAVGLKPTTRISNGGLDANWLSSRGLPTVTLGAGQQDVHTTSETLDLASFGYACEIGLKLATGE
jgi:tripeptide aminopeptidase